MSTRRSDFYARLERRVASALSVSGRELFVSLPDATLHGKLTRLTVTCGGQGYAVGLAEMAAEEKDAMTELETVIADNRAAVDAFIAAARAIDGVTWTTPRAAGAWCPGQIVEHLALTYEYNRRVLHGTAEGMPFPISLLKPLIRRIVVDNTLRAGRFTRKGRAPKFFQPSPAPSAAPDVIARLTKAVAGFEADLRSRPRGETIDHPVFGTVPATDWVAVQAIHARHHRAQLPV